MRSTKPSTRRAVAAFAVAAAAAGLLTAVSAQSAAAAITPSNDATTLAHSLAGPGAAVVGASFVALPPNGTPHAVASTPLASFPTQGQDYAILTTGDATIAANPNSVGDSTTDGGGSPVRGDTDLDVSVLKVDLNVPTTANCLRLDFRFLSEEYPEYVGTRFNDAFVAELDTSDWTTSGSTISAPRNFAFDPAGNPITINAAGAVSMKDTEAAGTTYDGATPLLSAASPITPGAHSLYLSIFDQGDHNLDSAVFLDNLVVGSVPNASSQCIAGAQPKNYALALTPASSPDKPVGTSLTVTANLNDVSNPTPVPQTGATVIFSVAGANTASGTGVTNSSGNATFTYSGTAVGDDAISACYDLNGNAACDAGEATASATASWVSTNKPPVADNKSVTTAVGTPVAVTLSATDPDGDPLTYAVVTSPAHGTLSGTAPALTYTPAAAYSGPDAFTYTAGDGKGGTSDPAAVSITVTASNTPPVADAKTITTSKNTAVPVPLSGTDADGDPLTFAVATQPSHGTLSGTAPALTYTPDAGFCGHDSFTYTANDGTTNSTPATVKITVGSKLPTKKGWSAQLTVMTPKGKTVTYTTVLGSMKPGQPEAAPKVIQLVSAKGQPPLTLTLTATGHQGGKGAKGGSVPTSYQGTLVYVDGGKTVTVKGILATWDLGKLTIVGTADSHPGKHKHLGHKHGKGQISLVLMLIPPVK